MGLKSLVENVAMVMLELMVGGKQFGREVYHPQTLLEPSQPLLSQQG